MKQKIPIYQPDLSGNESKFVQECLDTSWISSKGKFVEQFEKQFSEYVGTDYGIGVCNGTVALHVSLLALGIGPGDEVIVPTLTYIASVNPITYVGATPVFVDSDPQTWQMDSAKVTEKITERTRAIIAVHLYGQPCDAETLADIAKKHNIAVVEDCAEAIGSYIGDKHVGTFGHIAMFSFYGNKTITTGEGGMILTNDRELQSNSLKLKGQGLAADKEYWHDIIGYNYRMTNICASIGVAQMERLPEFLRRKREVAKWYAEGFLETNVQFHEEAANTYHSYWMCCMLTPEPKQRDPLRKALQDAGVETRPVFYPIHKMPMYEKQGESFPVAENIGARGINLPSYPALSREQVDSICEVVKKFFNARDGQAK